MRGGVTGADARDGPRDSVTRRLAHEPFGRVPRTLLLTVRRYRFDYLATASALIVLLRTANNLVDRDIE